MGKRKKPLPITTDGLTPEAFKKKWGFDGMKPYTSPDPTRWKVKGKSKKEVEALLAKMKKKNKNKNNNKTKTA